VNGLGLPGCFSAAGGGPVFNPIVLVALFRDSTDCRDAVAGQVLGEGEVIIDLPVRDAFQTSLFSGTVDFLLTKAVFSRYASA